MDIDIASSSDDTAAEMERQAVATAAAALGDRHAVPRAYPLRLRLADGSLVDFDADPIPLAAGGQRAGLAHRLVRTVHERCIDTLDGWIVYPKGARRRVTIACSAVVWCDDRTPSEGED